MNTRPLMTMQVKVARVLDVGAVPYGTRRIAPLDGGTFEGPRLRGTVLPGSSADWLLLRSDGVLELDLRATLRTDDGALIHMTFAGMRDDVAGRGYFRTLPRFETAALQYAFLNRLVAVGTGRIQDGAPVHAIEEVL